MGMGGRPGRPRPARDAHQPLLVRRNYLLCPRDIAFPDEVMRSRVWPTLGLGYYVSQPFDPMAVSSHNPKPTVRSGGKRDSVDASLWLCDASEMVGARSSQIDA